MTSRNKPEDARLSALMERDESSLDSVDGGFEVHCVRVVDQNDAIRGDPGRP